MYMYPSPSSSSPTRWNPTPEQLMILEEMYRSGGVRTPNAFQIQQITAHLARYGKIEGKNVFYWFQNHKARDRQRLRRKLPNKKQLIYLNNIKLHHHYHSFLLNNSLAELSRPGNSSTPQMQSCYTCKSSSSDPTPERCQVDKSYGCDWLMMVDHHVGPSTKPLKTLELFPITSTGGLEQECTTPKHFPSTTKLP